MYPRRIGSEVLASLKENPVVALLGPRQCGKTTLAKGLQKAVRKPTVYLDLELPSDRAKLADPELFLRSLRSRLFILDEIQRQPELFTVLRLWSLRADSDSSNANVRVGLLPSRLGFDFVSGPCRTSALSPFPCLGCR